MKTLLEQIDSFFAALRAAYSRQGPAGKIILPALLLLGFCCLCSIPIALLPLRSSPTVAPSPVIPSTGGTQASPTGLFDFPTFTPFPTGTAFLPTPFPTLTPSLTPTQTPTRTLPPATATAFPTDTDTPLPPTPTEPSGPVVIIAVNKAEEYAEIRNVSPEEINLRGWRLVSENGDESCTLRGTLEPDEVRRIWVRRGDPGFDCRLGREIWIDDEVDPAILYNPDGEEVSRFP